MRFYWNLVLYAVLSFCFAVASASAEDKIGLDDLLKHHLESIGSAETRSAAKTRVVEGDARYQVLESGVSPIDGRAALVSDGQKLHMMLKINFEGYSGERFIRNSDKTRIEATHANKTRSPLGTLLDADDIPLRDGLIGGVLTTDWALLDPEAHKEKLKYEGLKNVSGKDLYVVSYHPGGKSELQIKLYFEQGTFHHLHTVYTQSKAPSLVTSPPRMGPLSPSGKTRLPQLNGPDVKTAQSAPTVWSIEESFDDFKTRDGLTLPTHYELRFERQLPSRAPSRTVWEVTTTRVLNNVSVDDRNFTVE
jgi:hypothetical protein